MSPLLANIDLNEFDKEFEKRGIERMVVPSNQGMHMETMEATEDKDEKSDETRNSKILLAYGG